MGTDSSDGPCWYQNRQRRISIDDNQVVAFLNRIAVDVAKRREFAVHMQRATASVWKTN